MLLYAVAKLQHAPLAAQRQHVVACEPALDADMACLALQIGNGLTGTIPALDKLRRLTYAYLGGNDLTGTLPHLPVQLWELDLGDNDLTGLIPVQYSEWPAPLAQYFCSYG